MFLEDGRRRIDYIMVWSSKNSDRRKEEERERKRERFEHNLREEGLVLEEDIRVSRLKDTNGINQRQLFDIC